MRLILTTVAATALLATGFAGRALAHGGSYRGPAGEVPPDSREPSDPPPPNEGGGPGTPGGDDPGGPTTGGGDVGGPTTGGGGGGGPGTGAPGGGGPSPGGPGGGGPTTGGGGGAAGASGPGYEDWTFWWNFNKDEILSLKSIIKANQRGAPTGSGAHALGHGTGGAVKTATDAKIQDAIVPALRDILKLQEKDINFDIQSAAALALCKIGDTTIIDRLKEFARNNSKTEKFNRIVEESAALGFGLLQKDTPEIREFLLELLNDKEHDASFVRSFAAVSLGLLGSANDKDNVVPAAFVKIVDGDEKRNNVKPTCLLSLGLLKNDSQCDKLLSMLTSGKTPNGKTELSEVEMAFVVQALGKIGKPGFDKAGEETKILDTVVGLVDSRSKAPKAVRRSAAIALGQLAVRTDLKMQKQIVNQTLKKLINDTDDAQERHFALIALGRIGATPGVDKETRAECVKVLNWYLDKGKNLTPPFAAMGLGLIGRQMSLANEAPDEENIRAPIRKRFEETKDARSRGAYAVASGLVRDSKACRALIEVLQNKGDAKLRGYTALALGMIGDASARDAIRNVLTNDADRELRVQTAVAAGLMGDAGVIPDLVKILQTEESQYILGSVALALGQIGDERAIDPLLAIVKDEKRYPDLTRALATAALGQIGDRRDVPTLARVATDINYRAHVPALTELLTIL